MAAVQVEGRRGAKKVFVTVLSQRDWKRSGRGEWSLSWCEAFLYSYSAHLAAALPCFHFDLLSPLFAHFLCSFYAFSSLFPSSPPSFLVCLPCRHIYNPSDSDRCWWPDLWEQRQASVHTGAGPTVLLSWSADRWVCLYICVVCVSVCLCVLLSRHTWVEKLERCANVGKQMHTRCGKANILKMLKSKHVESVMTHGWNSYTTQTNVCVFVDRHTVCSKHRWRYHISDTHVPSCTHTHTYKLTLFPPGFPSFSYDTYSSIFLTSFFPLVTPRTPPIETHTHSFRRPPTLSDVFTLTNIINLETNPVFTSNQQTVLVSFQ